MAKIGLCIGINDYPGTRDDLGGCVNDAKDWADALERRGFKVNLLLNQQATGDGIRTAIKSCFKRAKDRDSVIITFSGHGSQIDDIDGDEKDGTDECICPYDVVKKKPITDDELFTLFDGRSKSVRFVFIADSCNSGTIRKASSFRHRVLARFLPPGTFGCTLRNKRRGTKRFPKASPPGRSSGLFLTGCREDESSYDDAFGGRANGAFTFVALRTLLDLPATVTYAEWFKRIKKELPTGDYAQSPVIDGTEVMKRWRALS